MEPILFIIRGISGSGKTTMANKLHSWYSMIQKSSVVYSADDYFTNPVSGKYYFNPDKLKQAHADCQANVECAMQDKNDVICVHNTFTRQWEIQPYRDLAAKYGYDVFEIICNNRFQNVHEVPADKVQQQRERFEL